VDTGFSPAARSKLMKSITFTETSDISDVSIMILDDSIQNHRDLAKRLVSAYAYPSISRSLMHGRSALGAKSSSADFA
jgi:hypothetical protein